MSVILILSFVDVYMFMVQFLFRSRVLSFADLLNRRK